MALCILRGSPCKVALKVFITYESFSVYLNIVSGKILLDMCKHSIILLFLLQPGQVPVQHGQGQPQVQQQGGH